MTTPDTALCVAGIRCAGYDNTAGQPAATARSPLCDPCLTLGVRATNHLHRDYNDLGAHLARTTTHATDSTPAGRDGPPIPIRLDIDELQRTIWWITTTWAEILADRHQLTGLSKRTRPGWAVTWAVTIIAPRITLLAQTGPQQLPDYPLAGPDDCTRYRGLDLTIRDGATAVADLIALHRRAERALGLTDPVRHLPGYCHNHYCRRPDLRQANGSDDVHCGTCGNVITRDDYDRYGNALLTGGPT